MAPQVWQLGASPMSYKPRMASLTCTGGAAPSSELLASSLSAGLPAIALDAESEPMVPSIGTVLGRGMVLAVLAPAMPGPTMPEKRESWCPERKRSWSQRKM